MAQKLPSSWGFSLAEDSVDMRPLFSCSFNWRAYMTESLCPRGDMMVSTQPRCCVWSPEPYQSVCNSHMAIPTWSPFMSPSTAFHVLKQFLSCTAPKLSYYIWNCLRVTCTSYGVQSGRWCVYGQSTLYAASYKQHGHELKQVSCHFSLLFSSTDITKDPFGSS